MNRPVLVLVLALAGGTLACSSDGALGDNGLVRFSFVGNYASGANADTPVATHSTLRILLQHPQDTSVVPHDGSTFTQLNLTAKPISGGDVPSIFPTGIAEYGIYFDKAGTYQLTALEGDKELDHLSLTVEDPDALVFDSSVEVVTTSQNGCGDSKSVAIGDVDLAENQVAGLVLVPKAHDKPLMGLPALVADATHGALTTVASSYALTPLSLSVQPTDAGKAIELTATDLGNHLTAKATLKTHAGQADVTCH